MSKPKHKLTLHQPEIYQIRVPGEIDPRWSDWNEGMTIAVDREVDDEGNSHTVTTLTGTLDQAALQGLLHRLYGLGLPLISVVCVEYD